jgi:glycosyltransferase involved in cell wall biosynthesis
MMPKVSVLMNCYNGEKYLSETLESLKAQTFDDYEVVFIDNCSTDGSAEMAKAFGERLNYYKTDENIPLGAARQFGIKHCQSRYVAFLDTDDIWLPHALQTLYGAISSGDYALAYGHQYLIDKDSKDIGEIRNLYAGQKGHFFSKLLKQFDIPLVASIIDKDKMLSMNLNFDENIFGSEEYCLFVQMSVESKFIAIDDYLVKYRVHNSLTMKLNDKIHKERFYTLDKIIHEHEGIKEEYPKEFQEAYARGAYYKAQYLMSQGESLHAFKSLSKYMFVDLRYFILSLLTLLPAPIWNYVQKKKYKR